MPEEKNQEIELRKGMAQDAMMTRVSLIGRAKDKNDQVAWNEFTLYYRKYLYNIIRKTGLPHTDAEDVVQNTLIRIWNALPKFNYDPKRGHFRSWLCKIATNAAKNYVRDRGVQPISLFSEELNVESIDALSIPPEIEEMAEQEWQKYLPELALKNIRSAFDMKTIQAYTLFINKVPVPQIAQRLGIAESSVYVYKKRVADRLEEEIKRLQSIL